MSSAAPIIRELRERAQLSQAELGLKVGKSDGAVSQWEAGRTTPRRDVAFKLDKILGGDGRIVASLGYALPDDAPSETQLAVVDHEQRISQLEAEVRELLAMVGKLGLRGVKGATTGSRRDGRSSRAAP